MLNLLTTLAMVRIGKVESNLMVDVRPSNAPSCTVRCASCRLTGADAATAEQALQKTGWVIRGGVPDACADADRSHQGAFPASGNPAEKELVIHQPPHAEHHHQGQAGHHVEAKSVGRVRFQEAGSPR